MLFRSWVTWGKEVENYLPDDAVLAGMGKKLRRYDAITKTKPNIKKRDFAEKAIAHMNDSDVWLKADSDLKRQVGRLVEAINAWNK